MPPRFGAGVSQLRRPGISGVSAVRAARATLGVRRSRCAAGMLRATMGRSAPRDAKVTLVRRRGPRCDRRPQVAVGPVGDDAATGGGTDRGRLFSADNAD